MGCEEKILDILQEDISRFDRMVDETEFQVDQMIYNQVAHTLRRVRDKFKYVIKENKCHDS